MEKDKLLDCISEEYYNKFRKIVEENAEYYVKKQLVIFGAGIMGIQFSYVLEQCGRSEFIFCDNDKKKQGKTIRGRSIISPEQLRGQAGSYFIFLAMENNLACIEQIEEMGYCKNTEWCRLINQAEIKLVKDFISKEDAEVLILADCFATSISFSDKTKESLASILDKESHIKVLSMNGLYMRFYYILLLMSLEKMPFIRKAVILLDLSIFHGKYHLLPSNQHREVLNRLYEISGIATEESRLFMAAIENREKNINMGYTASPDRSDDLSMEKIEQGKKAHLKLNCMYELKEDTESVVYLDKLLQECRERKIECHCIVLPVNYEIAEDYFGKDFYIKYEKIRDGIKKHIEEGGGLFLDLSYILGKEDFISVRSTNEGIRENGRVKIAHIIRKYILGQAK